MKIFSFVFLFATFLSFGAQAQTSSADEVKALANPLIPLRVTADESPFSPFFECLKKAILNSKINIHSVFKIVGPIPVANSRDTLQPIHVVRYMINTEYKGVDQVDLAFLSDDSQGWKPEGENFGNLQAQSAATMRPRANLIHFKRDQHGKGSRDLDRIDISNCRN